MTNQKEVTVYKFKYKCTTFERQNQI